MFRLTSADAIWPWLKYVLTTVYSPIGSGTSNRNRNSLFARSDPLAFPDCDWSQSQLWVASPSALFTSDAIGKGSHHIKLRFVRSIHISWTFGYMLWVSLYSQILCLLSSETYQLRFIDPSGPDSHRNRNFLWVTYYAAPVISDCDWGGVPPHQTLFFCAP